MIPSSAPITDAEDIAYVIRAFANLEELAARYGLSMEDVEARIAARLLPQPTYALADGACYVPQNYFETACDFDEFRERMRHAGASRDITYTDEEIRTAWDDFLAGGFGICLIDPTPETIVWKDWHVRNIVRLLGSPAPEDLAWRLALRSFVDGLDAVERQFTKFDRQRFGSVTRDRYVRTPRNRYAFLAEHTTNESART
jgi:Family of unknown function (DUF6058)